MYSVSHSIRNELTEYKRNYRRYNPPLMDSYVGLKPSSLSNLAIMLFCRVINNQVYHQGDHGVESRRIYSNLYLTMDDLLEFYDPVKYSTSESRMSHDASNRLRELKQLFDMNIFYCWAYRKPYSRMFIMERDIAVWKYYNREGCVIPRTLRKIIRLSHDMVDTMLKIESQRGRECDKYDVRNSLGYFMNEIIDKMNPSISKKLPRWAGRGDVFGYISEVSDILKPMGDFDGLNEEDDFIDRLPPSLRDKIHEKEGKEMSRMANKKKMMSTIADELVPENANIVPPVKIRKKRKRKTKTTTTSTGISPELETFQSIDPFKNCNEFSKFYRVVVSYKKPDAIFTDYDCDRHEASVILDILKDSGRFGDKDFLIYWIWYFVDLKLKGNNHKKTSKTELSCLKSTFDTYHRQYD